MDELSAFFPDNITYAIPYDTSPYVEISIEQVVHTLLEAMVLVFVVMFVFLQNVRRSEEHTSELQSLMRISYDVSCLKKKSSSTVAHTRCSDRKHVHQIN